MGAAIFFLTSLVKPCLTEGAMKVIERHNAVFAAGNNLAFAMSFIATAAEYETPAFFCHEESRGFSFAETYRSSRLRGVIRNRRNLVLKTRGDQGSLSTSLRLDPVDVSPASPTKP